MSVFQLSNYLLVCERDDFYELGGCGSELFLEQKRSTEDAAAVATEQGWLVNPPGQWDIEQGRGWLVLCSYCNNMRKVKVAAWEAKKAAAAAGLGEQ